MRNKSNWTYGEAMTVLKVFIALLILTAILDSCSTLKTDQKHLAQIQVRNPQLIADNCAIMYPPKTETKYIPGKETHTSDTVIVEGKRIPCPPVVVNKDTVINWVNCPPSKVIHDTIRRIDTVFIQVENTAKLAAKDYELMQVRGLLKKAEDKADRRGKTILYLIIGLVVSVGWNFRKLILKLFV